MFKNYLMFFLSIIKLGITNGASSSDGSYNQLVSQNTNQKAFTRPLNITQSGKKYIVYQQRSDLNFSLPFLVNQTSYFDYYLIEIRIQDIEQATQIPFQASEMMLLYKQSTPPQFSVQNGQVTIDADAIDQNGFFLHKTYLYIIITSFDPQFQRNQNQYISTIIPDGTNFTFLVSITAQNTNKPCPNSCSGLTRGSCMTNGYCQCYDGYVDVDCSTPAQQITLNSNLMAQISPNNVSYFYFQPSDTLYNDLLFTAVDLSAYDAIDVSLKLEGKGYIALPCPIDNDGYYTVTDSLKLNVANNFFIKTLQLNRRRRLLIGVSYSLNLPSYDQSINCTISVTTQTGGDGGIDSSWILIYFLIGIASLLFVSWIIITIVRIKYSNRAQQLQQRAAAAGVQPRQQGVVFTLSKEDLQTYMPSLNFEQIKDTLEKDGSCAVCLNEFLKEEQFRRTTCKHVFHSTCIEHWFQKHENCPLCRENLSKEDIIKHIEAQKNEPKINNNILLVRSKTGNHDPEGQALVVQDRNIPGHRQSQQNQSSQQFPT